MRSLLEQRFAAYLDRWAWPWKYEPQAFQIDMFRWYTPDFLVLIAGPHDVYIELKPTWELALEDVRIKKLSTILPDFCMAVWGYDEWTGVVLGQDTIWRSDLEDLQACIDGIH